MENSILVLLASSPLSRWQLMNSLGKQYKSDSIELDEHIKKLTNSAIISSHKYGPIELYYINTSPSSSSSSKPTKPNNHLGGGLSTSLKSRISKKFVPPLKTTPPATPPKKFKTPFLSSSTSTSTSTSNSTQKGTKRTIEETENTASESSTKESTSKEDPFITQKNEIENLLAEKKKLETLIVEKEQQLKTFQEGPALTGPYKPGDEDGKVINLTKKWVSVCQEALLDLEKRSVNEEGKPNMTVGQIISAMQIDPKLVKYDVDSETFE
eukprot:TRINITY_DN3044_c0_g1_i1.p1 TRINITY_DN3044_c0_g1~~TRINITY_DN3044_c0_g1_i1.p1  ORF type:complete len:268 (-),score=60.86 TRINITY_DN3044_c0_g1_i1:97-900(-)